jgi:hypothetical protein
MSAISNKATLQSAIAVRAIPVRLPEDTASISARQRCADSGRRPAARALRNESVQTGAGERDPMRPFPLLRAAVLALLGLLAGCSSDDQTGSNGKRPAGPAASVVGVLAGGKGIHLASAKTKPLPDGWVEAEYAVEGTAVSYASDADLPADGMLDLREDASAEYRTRIVVRRPGAAADFNGTVVVEWLNVSADFDADPDFAYLADELLRGGYAWVGVSAQYIGIEGGPVLVPTPLSEQAGAGVGLRGLDPERYAALHHPGDAFAYDIYTQIARTLRVRGGVLGELEPTQILAVGESQSAFMLTTYANGVHPLALEYDGFLIHSRGRGAAPLGEAGSGVNLLTSIIAPATRLRTDLQAPILVLETETDMLFTLNYYLARQDDSERFRSWEVAGTAHADQYIVGDVGALLDCAAPINAGPHHFVAKAALRHLDGWVRGGAPPPEGALLSIDSSGSSPGFVRDQDGIVLGGIRTPQVDVPVDVLSGAPAGGSIACTLFGSTTPLSAERIAERYASPEAYLEAYTQAADATIAAGFVLAEERAALLADADPSRVGP